MTVASIEAPQSLIRWHYLGWALAAIAVMIAAIVANNFWFLDFMHVFTGLLWTGIAGFLSRCRHLVPNRHRRMST